MDNPNMIPWLRSFGEKGDKDGLTSIDVQSLGRVADALELQSAENSDLKRRLEVVRGNAKRWEELALRYKREFVELASTRQSFTAAAATNPQGLKNSSVLSETATEMSDAGYRDRGDGVFENPDALKTTKMELACPHCGAIKSEPHKVHCFFSDHKGG